MTSWSPSSAVAYMFDQSQASPQERKRCSRWRPGRHGGLSRCAWSHAPGTRCERSSCVPWRPWMAQEQEWRARLLLLPMSPRRRSRPRSRQPARLPRRRSRPRARLPRRRSRPRSRQPARLPGRRCSPLPAILLWPARRASIYRCTPSWRGTTSLTLPRHVPETGWQSHYDALGVRLAGAPRGAWWALELEISSESLAGPLSYSARGDSPRLEVRGPWRRALLGMRAQFGTRWLPSVYAGIGAHAHLREIQGSDAINARQSSTMNFGGVLALGAGLQYRTRDVLLGLDVQVRLGEPDAYRAIMALVSAGRVLDQGE